jgi:dTDP-4-amino-4,6-dideoxygalactose transaminase
MPQRRIYLSPPHMSGREMQFGKEAFDSNWIAPLGPNVDAFERDFARKVGSTAALALASGTAAIHLALIEAGVEAGDEVLVSDLTFVGSVNPITYCGARPVLIDAEPRSWNLDPDLVEEYLTASARADRLPAALIAVHLYGQPADMAPILSHCREFGVPLIEDAAEALGASYRGQAVGTLGAFGTYSFNGNKIITTSGGGMLIGQDEETIDHARKLSSQAREATPYYQHSEIGFNYRMSNVLAGIGRGQLSVLEDRVRRRREIHATYRALLGDVPGIRFQEELTGTRSNRWLTCVLIDEEQTGTTPSEIIAALEAENIEARPLWNPMHLQPLYADAPLVGSGVAETLFREGICLPSGTAIEDADVRRIAGVVRSHLRFAEGD